MANLLGVGQSALMAAYAQLQTTGHNIANANTVGYSRQEALLATAGGQYTGGGFLGTGVNVTTIQRRYDGFLAAELASSTAASAADAARAGQLGRLDSLLADTDNGIGAAIDEFNQALADVANRPFDASAREAVLARADTLAQRIRTTDQRMQQIGVEANERIADAASSVNALLERFAQLNDRIAQASMKGQSPNDLLDERDRVLLSLNEIVKVTSHPQDDGTVNLFAAGGEGLVVGNRAARLASENDPADPSRQRVVMTLGATKVPMDAVSLGGGALAGLVRFRDEDLQAARSRVGQIAAGIMQAFNDQQALGVDATGAAGQSMFGLGRPQVLSSSTNAGAAALAASVIDGTVIAASDYTIEYDGSQYVVERSSDGLQRSFASLPQDVDGLRISLASGTPAAGDTYLLRSATAIASGFSRALSSGSRLATGYAVTAQLGTGNAGDVSVSAFAVSATGANLGQPVTLTFTGAASFDVSGTGTGDPSGLAYTPGAPITFNGWTVTLKGTPRAGDRVEIVPIADPVADNRNVKSMIRLADRPLAGGATFNDAFAAMLADVGNRTQSAQASETVSESLLESARAAHAQHSAVNLDEEAARLMQYQQMYQAAAKVIQAAQSMFDTLLSAAGR